MLRGAGVGGGGEGKRFVAFLTGREGQAVLRESGFRAPDGNGGSAEGDRVRRLPSPGRAEVEGLLRQWQQAG